VSLQRCLTIRETSLGEADESLVTPLNNLGLICKRRKEFDAAYDYFSRALTILESLRLQEDMQFGTILNNAASVLYLQRKLDDARDLLRRAAEYVYIVIRFCWSWDDTRLLGGLTLYFSEP
jgi:tetratricopeptide (TPR) repeat protein